MEILNWKQIKFIELNWNGQNLNDWIEPWSNLKGVICNLAKKKKNNNTLMRIFNPSG